MDVLWSSFPRTLLRPRNIPAEGTALRGSTLSPSIAPQTSSAECSVVARYLIPLSPHTSRTPGRCAPCAPDRGVERFKIQLQRDDRKRILCRTHGITLIEIDGRSDHPKCAEEAAAVIACIQVARIRQRRAA